MPRQPPRAAGIGRRLRLRIWSRAKYGSVEAKGKLVHHIFPRCISRLLVGEFFKKNIRLGIELFFSMASIPVGRAYPRSLHSPPVAVG
jgi:hypothetical protein